MLYSAVVGTIARLLLAWSGVGASLAWRLEVSTAANSNLELREGLALFRLGVSPYIGSSCRTPPLALWLHGALAEHDVLYVLPNAILDVLAALLLYRLALHLLCCSRDTDRSTAAGRPLNGVSGAGCVPSREPANIGSPCILPSTLPSALAWAYLLNPFILAASAGGTTSSLESMAVVATLYGACSARPVLAALGLAAAVYMSLHSVVLLLPVACLLSYGPEDVAIPLESLLELCRTRRDAGGGEDGGDSSAANGASSADGDGCEADGVLRLTNEAEARCQSIEGDNDLDGLGSTATTAFQGRTSETAAAATAAAVATRMAAEKDVRDCVGGCQLDALPQSITRTLPSETARSDSREGEPDMKGGGPDSQCPAAEAAPSSQAHERPRLRSLSQPPMRLLPPPPHPLLPWRQLLRCIAMTAVMLTFLVVASDLFLLSLPPPLGIVVNADGGRGRGGNTCFLGVAEKLFTPSSWPPLPLLLSDRFATAAGAGEALQRLAEARSLLASCWAVRVYGSQVMLDDATPNVGQWWYLTMEVFNDAKAYLRLLAHSLLFAPAPALAMRLGVRRPLALFLIQLLCLAFTKPYPSIADVGLAATLLLLLGRQQLAAARLRLLLPASLALLCVLGPSMQRMWLSYESANSNFFYSITLLYGVWQVVLVGHVLGLTLWLDRVARGKEGR